MAEIKWTEPALNDLNDIAEYIAIDNLAAAKTLVSDVFDRALRLKTFPESGRYPPELEWSRYREILVDPCRIFYRIEKDTVYILYVMRSGRTLRRFILKDRGRDGA
ncbi:type II toxin-antitoxin system RelE/ParE family toxin [Agaribacter flavus]|uniref:Type II toxin-antitoxin system RelE/ParE family toxin n=1 Tax=Agaribacter flavus TaxID=1902781 RepID=A0ABV7FWY0_9ALTE